MHVVHQLAAGRGVMRCNSHPADDFFVVHIYPGLLLLLLLQEIFSTCLSPEAMRQLLNGPHTQIRAAGCGDSSATHQLQQSAVPPGRGGGGTVAGAAGHSAGSKRRVSAASVAGRQQAQGLRMFFAQAATCLGCRQAIPIPARRASASASVCTQKGSEPGLCAACARVDGQRESLHITLLAEASAAERRTAAAHSACRACHSGGQLGTVLCDNGECVACYERVAGERALHSAQHKLERLEL